MHVPHRSPPDIDFRFLQLARKSIPEIRFLEAADAVLGRIREVCYGFTQNEVENLKGLPA